MSDGRIPALIMGAGGHGKTVAELLRFSSLAYVKGFIDPNIPVGTLVHGFPVLGADSDVKQIVGDVPHIGVIAFGFLNPTAQDRIDMFKQCVENNLLLPPIVHPTAFVDPTAVLGAAVQVHAGAHVGADAVVAEGTVINTKAVVEHDCQIGKHAFIAPGALLAGGVHVGAECLIGMGAPLFAGISIGAGVTVNSGRGVFTSLDATN